MLRPLIADGGDTFAWHQLDADIGRQRVGEQVVEMHLAADQPDTAFELGQQDIGHAVLHHSERLIAQEGK